MAAQAIAQALDTDLFVVDISRIVSKYVGETEKNLDMVFDDAERAGAVLLFDEADGLFTRRSDQVRDAHDRYANLEVAFMLQRIEAYSGIAVLTTNLRQNLDQAFMRRLRFVVDFPKPDAQARERIWQQCLTSKAPRQGDIDFRYLARHLDLTGGHIRQITLRAAFAAAADGGAIHMRHIVAATRAEMRKLGLPDADLDLAA
jgi:SpoVK/Ycf46/Vps4 family AAA+-type ATPase